MQWKKGNAWLWFCFPLDKSRARGRSAAVLEGTHRPTSPRERESGSRRRKVPRMRVSRFSFFQNFTSASRTGYPIYIYIYITHPLLKSVFSLFVGVLGNTVQRITKNCLTTIFGSFSWDCVWKPVSTVKSILIQGDFFNCSSQFSVLKWKTIGSQSEILFHEILNVQKILVGWTTFFFLALKVGWNS